MTTTQQIDSIVHRHHADQSESDRTCRACGRPWPCDVQQIATVMEAARDATGGFPRSRAHRSTRRSAARTAVSV